MERSLVELLVEIKIWGKIIDGTNREKRGSVRIVRRHYSPFPVLHPNKENWKNIFTFHAESLQPDTSYKPFNTYEVYKNYS